MRKIIFLSAALLMVPILMLPILKSLTDDFIRCKIIKQSPTSGWTAKLVEFRQPKGVVYRLSINDELVWNSEKFEPRKRDFHPEILWSLDGKKVIVAVAGKRLMGWDVGVKRELSVTELFESQWKVPRVTYEGELPAPAGDKKSEAVRKEQPTPEKTGPEPPAPLVDPLAPKPPEN